jgi:hypothetical protein
MTIAHPRPDVVVKPLRGIDARRTIHAMWVRDRRAPSVAPMATALAAAAARRLGVT